MWYQGAWYQWFLMPLSWLFYGLSAVRRCLYKIGVFASSQPDVPVIVVGNISVGGNGKTPVVLAIADYYRQQGAQVGILSRGYGGKCKAFPHRVTCRDTAAYVGDEPALMARRSGLPVVIDPVRRRGAQALVDEHQCTLIICDDGLQHYALSRDIELVVMDNRLWGNGHLMPMGPLREGLWRLKQVDCVILNQCDEATLVKLQEASSFACNMTLTPSQLVNVKDPSKQVSIKAMVSLHQGVTAIAGIGHPERFFTQLKNQGFAITDTQAFADHHAFSVQDIPKSVVLMTEKDAVKVQPFAHRQCWYQPVDAHLPDAFYKLIDDKLKQKGYRC
jgi:tetraacyldisaccharide 4'-kinase